MAQRTGAESDDLGLSSDSDVEPEQTNAAAGEGAVQADRPSNDSDLREYGKSIGVDIDQESDLAWVVQEAFVATLPPSWSEHTDDEGRIYFFNQASQQSSWFHPMDAVFRELLDIVKALRSEVHASDEQRAEVVQAHIQVVHQRATDHLEGWSGPYETDGSGAYFHHVATGASTWESPAEEWQSELALRQQVLYRCLLSGRPTPEVDEAKDIAGTDADIQWFALPPLKLNLASRPRVDGAAAPPSPSSSRSFHTARSARSARSPRASSRIPSESSPSAADPVSDLLGALNEASSETSAIGTSGSKKVALFSSLPLEPRPASHSPRRNNDGALEFTFGTGSALAMPKFTAKT